MQVRIFCLIIVAQPRDQLGDRELRKILRNYGLLILLACMAGNLVAGNLMAGEPLKIISYNIRYQNKNDGEDVWANRSRTVAETLQAADIIGLQEVLSSQLDDLKRDLTEFEFYGVGRDDGQAAGEMVPIGIRSQRWQVTDKGTFWLSETPDKAGVKGWDAALPRIASWMKVVDRQSKDEWLIINTHFDHRGPKAREESGKLLRQWIADHAGQTRVVLIGDFNAKQTDAPVAAMTKGDGVLTAPPLRIARDEADQPDPGPNSTWNGFKAIEPGQRIDHMLLFGAVKVQSFTTLDPRTPTKRFASDHLPIQATLQAPAIDPANPLGVKMLDFDGDVHRQVVVDREEGQYLGHPTTVLLEDGHTILCVYPKGHGRGAILMKRSSDGGLTWSQRLATPDNWTTSLETPTIYRTFDAGGKKRLILFSGLYPIRLSVSEDDGVQWTPLAPIGNYGGIVAMSSLVAVRDKPGHYLALFHDDGRFIAAGGKASGEMTLYQTRSQDGGLTWSAPETIYASRERHLCEPGAVRSPDGQQIAVLLRENRRQEYSHIIFSQDEGQTWSKPRQMPASLSGDRHTAKYLKDGRLFISFRDVPPKSATSPTAGDWVAWVGTYQDLVENRPGQLRIRLKDNHKASDCAYPGVEVLPDGTVVTTTYGHWQAGQPPYILSVRIAADELVSGKK